MCQCLHAEEICVQPLLLEEVAACRRTLLVDSLSSTSLVWNRKSSTCTLLLPQLEVLLSHEGACESVNVYGTTHLELTLVLFKVGVRKRL